MRKIILIFILSFIAFLSTAAQKKVVLNLQQVDMKPIHFGFILGMHTQDFSFTPSLIPDEDGVVWYADVTKPSPGFTVGIISDLRLGEYFNLRFVPTLNFGDRSITYSGYQGNFKVADYNTTVLSTLTNFPLEIKYRAKRVNNYRPYLLAGAGVMFDFARKKDQVILLQPLDYFVEFGVGCDFYLPYFKFSPELKMCIGFNDMLDRDRDLVDLGEDIKYTNAISKLTSRLLVLSFNFE